MSTSVSNKSNNSKSNKDQLTSSEIIQISKDRIARVHGLVNSLPNGWIDVFSKLACFDLALTKAPNSVPCPKTGEGETKFRFRQRDLRTGSAIHNGLDRKLNDGIDVLAWYWDLSKTQACNEILDMFGVDKNQKISLDDLKRYEEIKSLIKSKNTHSPAEIEKRKSKLESVYKYTTLAGVSDFVKKYLSNRGIKRLLDNLPVTLGYNPSLYYKDSFKSPPLKLPAMMAIFRDKEGDNLTFHRTYLDLNAHKANVANPKKLMPPPGDIRGGAIQLYNPIYHKEERTWILGVAEGIETALSVTEATAIPTWSCYSASLMELLEIPVASLPPPDVENIFFTIWGDKDTPNSNSVSPGLKSAKVLEDRMRDFFKEKYPNAVVCIQVNIPELDIPEGKKGIDWNDVLIEFGVDYFPDRLNETCYDLLTS